MSIDVHAHIVPDIYRQALADAGLTNSNGQVMVDGYPAPPWSEQEMLSFMDENDVAAAVLSITTPGVGFLKGHAARDLARTLNEEFAALIRRHPHRVGAFAVLPLPDVDAALEEIAHALDTLHLDGVGLYSNVNGIHLGDARFDPIFEELDRRAATVFVHPAASISPEDEGLGFPSPMLEYPFDTTRMAANLVLSGALDRYRNVKLILSHGGGTLPVLAPRVAAMVAWLAPPESPRSPEHIMKQLQSLYYDLAIVSNHQALAAIKAFVPATQLLIGYDRPYTPIALTPLARQSFESFAGFTPEDRRAIRSGNANKLFPHLASRRSKAAEQLTSPPQPQL